LQNNPLFQEVVQQQERVYVADTQTDSRVTSSTALSALVRKLLFVLADGASVIKADCWAWWSCTTAAQLPPVAEDEVALVEAIASQVGAALIQAEAYANLEALDRTRSNLIAITGHELHLPFPLSRSAWKVSPPNDMPLELRQVMLNTALGSERMRKLVQDFLTLSNLESGRVEWHLESLSLEECIELAFSRIRTRALTDALPQVTIQVPATFSQS